MIADADLMAYADGGLDEAGRRAVEAAVAADPTLAGRLAEHKALRLTLRDAFADVLDEPVPDRLRAMLQEAEVARPAFGRVPAWRPSVMRGMALAACLVVGVAVGYGLAAQGRLLRSGDAGLQAAGGLDRALDRQISGDAPGAIAVGLTFATDSGAVCRTFTLRRDRIAGLACRERDVWRIPVTAAVEAAKAGDYRAAGADTPMAVLMAVDERIKGEVFTRDQERTARAAGWSAR